MSRSAVNAILVAHLVVVWSAFVFRIDRFPLTWAPMYSVYQPSKVLSRRAEDQEQARRGFRVTHRDGSQSYVGAADLNISKWIMSRLYFQRAFGKGPAKHKQGNMNLGRLNRFVRGLGEGEDRFQVDWTPRLFMTLNNTLGYEFDDPRFIVKIKAHTERIYYDAVDVRFLKRKTKKVVLDWDDAWRDGKSDDAR